MEDPLAHHIASEKKVERVLEKEAGRPVAPSFYTVHHHRSMLNRCLPLSVVSCIALK
jgi:hypothetical protein